MAKIHITHNDYDRLKRLLDKKRPHDSFYRALQLELDNSERVEPKDIPHDVITMNSHVRFTDEHGKDQKYWLVFPEDVDLAENKISVLSPIGCALLGYKVGDTVTLTTPQHGRRELVVAEILSQPEREGNFDL